MSTELFVEAYDNHVRTKKEQNGRAKRIQKNKTGNPNLLTCVGRVNKNSFFEYHHNNPFNSIQLLSSKQRLITIKITKYVVHV